ncbi:MAG TPA: hypothetical protein VIM57_02960 [Luteolibacter sp.]
MNLTALIRPAAIFLTLLFFLSNAFAGEGECRHCADGWPCYQGKRRWSRPLRGDLSLADRGNPALLVVAWMWL